jgi:tRNA(Arg) A34 adenosine deaminase TadA
MASDKKMLTLAAEAALTSSGKLDTHRVYYLGAVGIRNDGVIVSSKNVSSTDVVPTHHAETRLARKLTPNSVVWVARVRRKNGEWAMARPCQNCQNRLRSSGVTKVVYTISHNEWGVMEL